MRSAILAVAAWMILWDAALAAAPAQAPSPALDVCDTTICRSALDDVVLRLDDARYRVISFPRSPYVVNKVNLFVFPGETIAIQFTLEGKKIVSARVLERLAPRMPAPLKVGDAVVDNPADAALRTIPRGAPKDELAGFPANVMLLSYGQEKGQPGAMLTIVHNLPGTIKFDALFSVMKLSSTDIIEQPMPTCPVKQNNLAADQWTDSEKQMVFGYIVLANPRFVSRRLEKICR